MERIENNKMKVGETYQVCWSGVGGFESDWSGVGGFESDTKWLNRVKCVKITPKMYRVVSNNGEVSLIEKQRILELGRWSNMDCDE